MALYTTFGELLTQLRAEARLSTNPAVGADANTRYKTVLNRVYETLYDSFDWPHLRLETSSTAFAAGQRYYDLPDGIDHTSIEQFIVNWSGNPYQIDQGIGLVEYAARDSAADEREDPPQRFDFRSTSAGGLQLEIWPLPASATATFRIIGKRKWAKLVNSSDLCRLDDKLVSLYAAADVLAPINSDLAKQKAEAGSVRLQQLRGRANVTATADGVASIGTGALQLSHNNGRVTVRVGQN
jgi:hypothetical protein